MPTHRSLARHLRRALPVVAVAALACVLGGSPALAATGSTTVTPAGDTYVASLTSGTKAAFGAGASTVTCSGSTATGQVAAAPGNAAPAGPVASAITPPSFTGCSPNVFLTSAKVTTNATNGDWKIALQYDPAGVTGSLTIPQGGQVMAISGLASCTITVAPNGPVTIDGTWTPGTATAAPKLSFSGVSVPIAVTGGLFCPSSSTSGTFSASYDVTDTTDPAAQISVGS